MTFHPADIVTLIVFLVGITALGYFSKRAVQNREDFFLGGRRFGKTMMAFHAFGTGTHTDQAVGVVAESYRRGLTGIWVQWNWMFATPIYWLLAPWLRRSRCLTLGDFFAERYSAAAGVMAVVVATFCSIFSMGVMLLGTTRTVQGMLGLEAMAPVEIFAGQAVPAEGSFYVILLAITAMFVLYGVAGGIVGAVRTDFVQGVFIIILSGLALPAALNIVGGLAGIRAGVPNAEFLTLVSRDPAQFDLWFIVALLILAPVSIVGQSHIMSVTSAGRNELDGRFGMCYGNFLKRFCTIAWCLLGIAWLVRDRNLGVTLEQADQAFGMAVSVLLPHGLLGLMMASVIAAAMSTSDSVMVAVSGLWTQNVYRRFIRPDAQERHYVYVGRIVSVIVVLGSLLLAMIIGDVVTGLFSFWKISACLGIAVWLALLWRRANSYGAWASCLAALVVYVVTDFVRHWPKDLWPLQIAMLLGIGAVVGVVVSLLTSPPKRGIIERFYTRLHTPVGQDEKLELPLDEAVPQERRLVDRWGLLIAKPNLESWGGFLIAWALVAFLVVGTALLV
ncbi:MAG: sodium:solute symporter family protein, partial [Armatimonadota bacterium]